MPKVLPEEFHAVHQLAFCWHDALADHIVKGEAAGLLYVKFQPRNEADAAEAQEMIGEQACDWLEQNGYRDVLDEQFFRHTTIALLSDLCHFLYEALRTSEKGKLAVSFALLRKPFRDNLFYLEWMLADRVEFMRRFREGGGAIDATKVSKDRKLDIIRRAMAQTRLEDWIDAEFIHDIRYDKDTEFGYEPTWHQAIHLITTVKQYATEPLSFNLIFTDDEDRDFLWERFYTPLVCLLIHIEAIIKALFEQFAPEFRAESEWGFPRRLAGLLLYASEHDEDGEFRSATIESLREMFREADLRCAKCNVSAKEPSERGELERFYELGELTCGCGQVLDLVEPDESDDREESSGEEVFRAAFEAWADSIGLPTSDRTQVAFAAFVGGWSCAPESDENE